MKESSTKLFVIALIGTICFCLFIFIKQLIKEYKSRNSILNGYFVSADMFLKKWNERYKNETFHLFLSYKKHLNHVPLSVLTLPVKGRKRARGSEV